MKYLFLVSLLVISLSCKEDTQDPDPQPKNAINPPAWIVGTWVDVGQVNEWTFTTSNAVYDGGFVTLDFKEIAKSATVKETSSGTKYTIELIDPSATSKYIFESTSATTLNYTVTVNGVGFGSLELTKQ
jgi:hypothetical protein